MKEDKKVPQLRFPEFSDAWKQRKFSDSFDFLQNNTLSRASLNDTSGCAKNVHYGDILVKFGESISAEKADLPFICDREILKKLSKSILKNGDVVIADTAEDMTTGKSCEIVDVDECMPVLAGLHTIPVRPKQKFGKYYLGYYLNSEAFHSQLIPLIQGIKVYSISKSSIKDTVVMFPDDVQEQEKIGSLFNRIDNTITLQQRKLNSLQKLKKGLLQKMFPKNGENITEIRFPEFSDAWKQRKFSDSFDFLQNNTLSRASLNDTSGCAKNVHYGDILVKFGESISAEKADLPFICDREILKKLSKSILKNGDVVIADTAEDMTTGKSCEIVDVDECMPVLAGLHTIPVRPKQKFGKYYLGYYLNSEAFHSQLIPLIQGIKVYSISKSSIKDTVVMFPDDVQEQEKIGSLFNRIDNTITLQQRKLESLQKLKKGLLQQMFI